MTRPPRPRNPFRDNALFVGRQEPMARIEENLSTGQSTLLIGGRRTGKTTLARQIKALDLGRPVIATDVSGWDLTSHETATMALQSALAGVPETRPQSGSRDDLVSAMDKLNEFALVIDEADRLFQTGWASAFFSQLRWLDDTRYRTRISILLIGGPVLAQFRDPEERGSPPLNYAEYEYMRPLNEPAVTELNEMLTNPADIRELFQWTGGNAWLASQVLSRMWRGEAFATAADAVHDQAAEAVFPAWQRQAGHQCLELLRGMPDDGLEWERILHGDLSRYRQHANTGRSVGIVRLEGDRLVRGPQPFTDWLSSASAPDEVWDLAISYAGEDLDQAREIYAQLHDEFRVFFAPQESGALWGQDLNRVLPSTYGVDARFVLVLSTPHYVSKHWTRLEFAEASRIFPERILFLDMGGLPEELPPGLVYRGSSGAEMINLIPAIRQKLAEGP